MRTRQAERHYGRRTVPVDSGRTVPVDPGRIGAPNVGTMNGSLRRAVVPPGVMDVGREPVPGGVADVRCTDVLGLVVAALSLASDSSCWRAQTLRESICNICRSVAIAPERSLAAICTSASRRRYCPLRGARRTASLSSIVAPRISRARASRSPSRWCASALVGCWRTARLSIVRADT